MNVSSISRRVWLGFSASIFALGATGWLAHRAPPSSSADATESATLIGEKNRLQESDDRALDQLREKQRQLARVTWTTDKLAAWQAQLGPAWRCTWEPGDAPSRVTLWRASPRIEEWPVYLAFVSDLEAQPGVVVESVEFSADGATRDRQFTRIAIGLRFTLAVAPSHDGPRAAPSRSPQTVVPAKSPATPRKVGASTSHRRPSASAEPPAPGTSGAAFRSRPSGVQGRRRHQQPTTKTI